MRGDAITLGDLAGKITTLEIACRRCERCGRVPVNRLIAQHGDIRLPELADILAGDCPRAESVAIGERCSAFFPQLLRLWERTGKSLDEL